MKKLLSLILAGLLPLAVFSAAATYTRQTAQITGIRIQPTYTTGQTAPTSVLVQFEIVQKLINDADAADIRGNAARTVDVDLLAPARASDVITAAGKTVNPPQLAALLRQYAIDRANAAGIP